MTVKEVLDKIEEINKESGDDERAHAKEETDTVMAIIGTPGRVAATLSKILGGIQ